VWWERGKSFEELNWVVLADHLFRPVVRTQAAVQQAFGLTVPSYKFSVAAYVVREAVIV
jgi:hypothetical protein